MESFIIDRNKAYPQGWAFWCKFICIKKLTMVLKDLYKNFGVTHSIEVEKEKFIARFDSFLNEFFMRIGYTGNKEYFMDVCFQLGVNGQEIINKFSGKSWHECA